MTPFFRGCIFSKISFALCANAFLASPAEADVSLPAIFSDHMVLQCDMTAPIWGWAQPGEEVTVSIGAESKSTNAEGTLYGEQLPMLINDWRGRWGQGDFPFAWVQLPNFMKPTTEPVESSGWALTRDSMRKTLALPKTGMTVNTDIGDAQDIHPKHKQEIGRRLALWALSTVYGQDRAYSGPLYDKLEIKSGHVTLSFTHTHGGLVAKGGDLKGFAIAGADRKWAWASAQIEGDKVWLTNDEIKEPVAVRYSWANNPDGTLCNGAGLPASPFRTDNW